MQLTAPGHFVWYDLMSPDTEASKRFYTEVLGWGTRAERPLYGQDGRPPYTMWTAAAKPIAGLVPFSEAYWLGYVEVADVGRSVMEATTLGGELIFDPFEIAKVGRFAVIEDPQGAAIALFQGAEGSPPRQPFAPQLLEFSWHQLATPDWHAALGFYRTMFGWETISQNHAGPLGDNIVFGQKGVPYGGMFDKPAEMPRAAWQYYVRVGDVCETASKVRQQGGQVINGPVEVAGGDWVAQCRDAAGGMFAVHQTASTGA
jgi:predicted enzyme related to lactoylglutathione lyase